MSHLSGLRRLPRAVTCETSSTAAAPAGGKKCVCRLPRGLFHVTASARRASAVLRTRHAAAATLRRGTLPRSPCKSEGSTGGTLRRRGKSAGAGGLRRTAPPVPERSIKERSTRTLPTSTRSFGHAAARLGAALCSAARHSSVAAAALHAVQRSAARLAAWLPRPPLSRATIVKAREGPVSVSRRHQRKPTSCCGCGCVSSCSWRHPQPTRSLAAERAPSAALKAGHAARWVAGACLAREVG
eukprot:359139-Chlamydomonas_euryale.AAC.2